MSARVPEPFGEEVIEMRCEGQRLWGVLSRPRGGQSACDVAVLVLVGGPQYRVGSHRQFVQLSRRVAAEGFPCLRFDYRGMGDSEGELRNFEHCEDDLRTALDALCAAVPQARRVVVWGLCDAASAALMFATGDPRVAGIVLANPWARSAATLGATRVKHYYGARLLERAFWAKLFSGRFDWRASLRSLAENVANATRGRTADTLAGAPDSFQSRMAEGLRHFGGQVLLIIAGKDLTALEFLGHAASAADWRGLLDRPIIRRVDIAEADHTFSTRAWSHAAEEATCEWLRGLAAGDLTRGKS